MGHNVMNTYFNPCSKEVKIAPPVGPSGHPRSELSELISAWSWAVGTFQGADPLISRRVNLDYQSTALAAQRLRGMKSDLITLLQNAPIVTPSPDLEKMKNSSPSVSLIDDNSKAQLEGSGEWEVDMQKLQQENEKDMALMVRHGLIDDMLENSKIDFSKKSEDDPLSVDFIEQKQQKTDDEAIAFQEVFIVYMGYSANRIVLNA